jgi:hypothetical protein
MWVQRSAIRPVPSYAKVGRSGLDYVRNHLLVQSDASPGSFDEIFEDFESHQPVLADHVGEVLSRPLQDSSVALGYFLSVSIWAAFANSLGTALDPISIDELRWTTELFALDKHMQAESPHDRWSTHDVVALEQPALVEFVDESMEATARSHGGNMDSEEMLEIHRMLLIEILALSYAVRSPAGFPLTKSEVLA